ncbi:MAG: SDR family oxidoreductase [Caldilineaceae bacterium]
MGSPAMRSVRLGGNGDGDRAITRYAQAEGRDVDEYLADIKRSNPQKRMLQPAEVAALVLYLCRDDALGMTMQDLVFSAGSLW